MILAGFHSTFTIPLNASLTEKVAQHSDTTYSAVKGLGYDATGKKLGLVVSQGGADTVIPFSGTGKIKKVIFLTKTNTQKADGAVFDLENDTYTVIDETSTDTIIADIISLGSIDTSGRGYITFLTEGYYAISGWSEIATHRSANETVYSPTYSGWFGSGIPYRVIVYFGTSDPTA